MRLLSSTSFRDGHEAKESVFATDDFDAEDAGNVWRLKYHYTSR